MIHIFKERNRFSGRYGADAAVAIYCDNTFCPNALHYPKSTREDIPAIMQEYFANAPSGWWSVGKGQHIKHYCSRHTK